MKTLIAPEEMVPLAPFTTLELGGPAKQFARVRSRDEAQEFVAWWLSLAKEDRPPLLPLGGGSNLLVSDSGFEGFVLKMENREYEVLSQSQDSVEVKVGAGLVWDDFVALTCEKNWAGVECLSGIPGCVGASPVQNIGAYGQEVSETIVRVEGLDLTSGEFFELDNASCAFSYRDSLFKSVAKGRYLITDVVFCLRPGGQPTVRYRDLLQRCEERSVKSLTQLRELVLEIRRSKSMVYDKADANHRSAGSFFTNPIVAVELADEIESGLPEGTRFPRFEAGTGLVKLSAAWLIDQSGLGKGFKLQESSKVGLSTKHVLALTNRGGGTSEELLQLCSHVQTTVESRFGVRLVPEPVFIGF